MRAIGSPFPDPVHLLASLCEQSRFVTVPLIAAAVGSHPIVWHELRWQARQSSFALPEGAWAIGVIGGGTTSNNEDVLVAFVVDCNDRRRAVIIRDDTIVDTADPTGLLVEDCRIALGLPRAA